MPEPAEGRSIWRDPVLNGQGPRLVSGITIRRIDDSPDKSASEQWLQEQLLAYDKSLDSTHAFDQPRATSEPQSEDTGDELLELQACVELLEEYRLRKQDPAIGSSTGASHDPPQAIARFVIRGEVGRGGGGIVFLADDPQLNREVALKIPRPESLVLPELRERFLLEARAAASLQHPHIVPVYEVGQDGAICYLASAYCQGGNLAAWIAEQTQPPAPRDAARLVQQLADAVQHAHSRGVLHRDIKPSNVLLEDQQAETDSTDEPAEVAAPARVKLSDFGLARLEAEGSQLTRTGAVIGTPAYMAPEQAEGRLYDVAAHTDVWALGAVLYELLSGRPPFQSQSELQILQRVVADEPVSLRRLRPEIPPDLSSICRKCLEKDPTRRYETAAELAHDLERFLENRPTQARPLRASEAFGRWVRRHPQLAGTSAALLVAALSLVAGLAFYSTKLTVLTSQLHSANESLENAIRDARKSQLRAEQSDARSQQLLYTSDIKLAGQAWADGDLRQFYERLKRHEPSADRRDSRGFEWHWLWQRIRSDNLTIENRDVPRFAVRFSPDGSRFATAGKEDTVRVYDAASNLLQTSIDTGQDEVFCLAFTPQVDQLVTGGDDGTMKAWDLASAAELDATPAHEGPVRSLALCGDGSMLASCGDDAKIRLWKLPKLDLLNTLEGHEETITAVAISPDGRLLASASHDQTTRLWDLETGHEVRRLAGHALRVTSLVFSPTGTSVLTGSVDGSVRWWHTSSGSCLDHFANIDPVDAVAYAPNEHWVVAGDRGGRVLVRPVSSRWFLPSNERVRWCGFSPDGKYLAAATWQRVVFKGRKSGATFELPLGDSDVLNNSHETLRDSSFPNRVFAFSPSGTLFACVTHVYHAEPDRSDSWSLARVLDTDYRRVSSVAFAPDGRTLALGLKNGETQLWDVVSGTRSAGLPGHSGRPVMCVAFAPDGSTLATTGEDGTAVVRDVATGKEIHTLDGHAGPAACVAFAPDGSTLATSGWDDAIRIWDAVSGQPLAVLTGHTCNVDTVAYAPDGRFLASTAVGFDNTIRIWDVSSGRCIRTLPAIVAFASFSPDGGQLAGGGFTDQVQSWDVREPGNVGGSQASDLVGHQGRVRSLSFAPDASRLASASDDGRVVLWQLTRRPQQWEFPNREEILDLVFSSSDDALYAATAGGILAWDLATRATDFLLREPQSNLTSLAVDGSARLVAYGTADGHVEVVDLRAHLSKSIAEPTGDSEIGPLQFSPQGRVLAARDWANDRVRLFDVAGSIELSGPEAKNCKGFAFSPNGELLVFNSENDVLLWDVGGGRETGALRGHSDTVNVEAFSPDGSLIASGGNDRRLILWDATKLEPVWKQVAHLHDVTALAFSPNGGTLVTGSWNGSVRAWHVATGQELIELAQFPQAVTKLAFSPGGWRLVCLLQDGRVEILETHPANGGR